MSPFFAFCSQVEKVIIICYNIINSRRFQRGYGFILQLEKTIVRVKKPVTEKVTSLFAFCMQRNQVFCE